VHGLGPGRWARRASGQPPGLGFGAENLGCRIKGLEVRLKGVRLRAWC
jgi:hypothetical protein